MGSYRGDGASKKNLWLERDLIQGPYYTLCTTEKQFRTELRKLNVKDAVPFNKSDHADATTHYFVHPKHGLCCIVCMPPVDPDRNVDPIQIAAILVHEAVHIWQTYTDRVGETEPSKEFEAYSIQRLSQSLMYEYTRQVFTPTAPKGKHQ